MLQHCKVVVNLCVLTIEIERMLFSEVRILGDAAFTRKPNDHPYLKKAYGKTGTIYITLFTLCLHRVRISTSKLAMRVNWSKVNTPLSRS